MNNILRNDEVIKDRYQIREVIGQGGMGCVYLADDLRLSGRLCALKEVYYDKDLPQDVITQTREQFEREATVLARLDHPNLPKVSDFFSDQERDYLVMDFVPGEDLRTLMLEEKKRGKFLEERKVLNWAGQIADALIYLHDTVEDTDLTTHEIAEQFNRSVAEGVKRLSRSKWKNVDQYYTKIGSDLAVSFVKLADRMANVDYSLNNPGEKSTRMLVKYRSEQPFLMEYIWHFEPLRPMLQLLNAKLK